MRKQPRRHRTPQDSMKSPDQTAAPQPGQARNSVPNSVRQSVSQSGKNSVQRTARQSHPQNSAPHQVPAPNSQVHRSAYATARQSSDQESEQLPNRQPAPLKPAQPPRKHAPNSGPAPPAGPPLRPDQAAPWSPARIRPPGCLHPGPDNAPRSV